MFSEAPPIFVVLERTWDEAGAWGFGRVGAGRACVRAGVRVGLQPPYTPALGLARGPGSFRRLKKICAVIR